ncbi:MAG: hypothetical protein NT069_07910, partial [Planctomycetota bacterium]|nr:hypothetical protein [Planctomycetota bacterium]
MIPRPTRISLPLLAKELIEQAARKRTYFVRVFYAVLLQFFGLLMFAERFSNTSNAWGILGHGRELFAFLTGLQFAGVYFFMPALVCGVITSEKERATMLASLNQSNDILMEI